VTAILTLLVMGAAACMLSPPTCLGWAKGTRVGTSRDLAAGGEQSMGDLP
jgi:hypothetical protein